MLKIPEDVTFVIQVPVADEVHVVEGIHVGKVVDLETKCLC